MDLILGNNTTISKGNWFLSELDDFSFWTRMSLTELRKIFVGKGLSSKNDYTRMSILNCDFNPILEETSRNYTTMNQKPGAIELEGIAFFMEFMARQRLSS